MKHLLLTLLFCALLCITHAQVSDQFTDGDFTFNPTWRGDDSLFHVVSGELKLNGTIASDAHLSTEYYLADSISWTFLCRFDLSPSTQNFARFYLASDQPNLEVPLNGYYVQLGGVTGNMDSITLYKQAGTIRTRVIGGRAGTISKTANKVRVKVSRDAAGNWLLYSDTSGGTSYILEGSGFDNTFMPGNYAGWFIKYTAGNSQKYYLDEVDIRKPIADLTPPLVDRIVVMNKNTLQVYFNEPVQAASAQVSTNYALSPGAVNPVSAVSYTDNVTLQFAGSFVSGSGYTLSVQQVSDEAGNIMAPYQDTFTYYSPDAFDLLISEFMPDPTPALGLPEQEFIELYNNTARAINLSGFTISDGGTPAVLPDVTIDADSFVIICSQAAAAFFSAYGKLAIVNAMPSLNNTGDRIILRDNGGDTLHQISYDLGWYQDIAKDDGGYTIELNYPRQLCKGKQVYSGSANPLGGTPGTRNSIWDKRPDVLPPGIASVTIINAQQFLVVFNEQADITFFSPGKISIQPAVPVASVQVKGYDSLYINLQTALDNNTSYILRIDSVKDCSANAANLQYQVSYYVPEAATNYDVLINEIMADPEPAQQLPATEYIELYNRSTKIISLKNWTLGDEGGFARLPDSILLPGSFLVITSIANSSLFNVPAIGVTGFPSLGNEGDHLVLKNETGQVIHAITYTYSWYTDGFKKQGGFSLELIDPKNPCGIDNWEATVSSKGGTPGFANSVNELNRDITTPRLDRAYLIDSLRVELSFSESLDSTSFKAHRFVLNATSHPVSVYGNANDYQSMILQFTDAFRFGQVYSIQVDSIADCAQNHIENYRSVEFERPHPADSGSLVINEALFNAKNNAYDFVELYNKSLKPVDLKNLLVGKRDADGLITETRFVAPGGFVVRPGEHAVLTENATSLQQIYFCKNVSLIVPAILPAYSDDKGHIILLNNTGIIYDELAYDDDMHFALLDDRDGVSLERIDFNRASNERTNWASAAASCGYATPTYRNSQYLQTERSDQALSLQPSRISPDADGYEDVMNINYSFTRNGYTGSLSVYDANGRVIKHLFKNEMLGTRGTYTWDGVMDNGNKAPVGIYLFRLEVFTLNGGSKEFTAVGVVAGKL